MTRCPLCGAEVARYSAPDDGYYCRNVFCSFDDENVHTFFLNVGAGANAMDVSA